ncbi:MAG: AraC family transcriptional regulator [Alphaproteobacteria bacterium]|nr:AraC family transcriptional regulator [Alphaproteobacteria bacterium]
MAEGDTKQRRGDESAYRSHPSFEQRIYSPHSISAIVAELGKQGLDGAAALEGTALTLSHLEAHTTRISYRQLDRVTRNALRLSKDPAIALRAGQRMRVTAYGMYGYAMLSSTTTDQARVFAARYCRVVGPFCEFVSSKNDEIVAVTLEPTCWPNPAEEAHRFAVEFALSAHLTIIRDWYNPAFRFSRIILGYAAPPHHCAYENLFECTVLFDQDHCGYEHPRDDGAVALADQRTHAMAREMCEQLLGEVNRAGGIAADVRRILIEQPGRYPTIEAIADSLGMYPRALRRKLEAEGTSYRFLLREVRMRLAIEYLRRTHMTNDEIASRLGYSDAANFRHAFVRWTGKSPSGFRIAGRA